MTTIRYFVPEDGDEETSPNVFLAAKSRHAGVPPTLGQIRDAFPLPGRYHFRFKSPLFPGGDRDKDALAVWMDCVKDSAPVPTWRNAVVAKVTRLGMEEEEDDDDDDFVNAGATAAAAHHPTHSQSAPIRNHSPPPPQQQQAPPPKPAPAADPSFDIFGTPAPASSSSPVPPSTGNLLDGHHGGHGAAGAGAGAGHGQYPASAPSSGGLLDFGGGPPAAPSSGNMHSDFLGMTAQPTPAATGMNQPYGQGQPGQQQQQQQQRMGQNNNQQNNTFNSFSNQQGPFGDLGTPWK